MRKAVRIIVGLYLGGMLLWYADRVFNSGIPEPRGVYVWVHQAIMTYLVVKLWGERCR